MQCHWRRRKGPVCCFPTRYICFNGEAKEGNISMFCDTRRFNTVNCFPVNAPFQSSHSWTREGPPHTYIGISTSATPSPKKTSGDLKKRLLLLPLVSTYLFISFAGCRRRLCRRGNDGRLGVSGNGVTFPANGTGKERPINFAVNLRNVFTSQGLPPYFLLRALLLVLFLSTVSSWSFRSAQGKGTGRSYK